MSQLAKAVFVCPQCERAFTVMPDHHALGDADCMGIPEAGTWVPQGAYPALVNHEGMVERIPLNLLPLVWSIIDPAAPTRPVGDRENVVKPEDGDERYFDDEQEKAGR